MALANCILGKFLGVVCHCFPPAFRRSPFAARCLYIRKDARDPSSERWNCGRETVRQFCLNSDFHVNLGIFYMPQIYDMGPTALLPLRRKACWGFFRPKNLTCTYEVKGGGKKTVSFSSKVSLLAAANFLQVAKILHNSHSTHQTELHLIQWLRPSSKSSI